MATFISQVKWTDQGIRNIKDSPNRLEVARAALRDLGGEIKDVYFTPGENDLLLIVEAPDGEVMMKFNLAVAAQGNLRTNTTRGYTEAEFQRIVADLP